MGLFRLRLAVPAAAVVVTLGGCGDVTRSSHRATVAHIACSEVVSYRSLAELRKDATSVVVLHPTGATTVRRVSGLPFTVAKVRVIERIAGSAIPASFGLRQTGARGVVGDEGCTALVSGAEVYLAYLAPFRLRVAGPGIPGQYVVVGGTQGLFQHAGPSVPADDAPAFSSVAHRAGSRLPTRISIAAAR
jgi:hypothetical protein